MCQSLVTATVAVDCSAAEINRKFIFLQSIAPVAGRSRFSASLNKPLFTQCAAFDACGYGYGCVAEN